MLHCKIRPTRTSYPQSIVSSSIWIWQLSCLFKQLRRLCRYCKTGLQAADGKKKTGGQATSFLGVPWAAILSSPLKKEWQISPEKTPESSPDLSGAPSLSLSPAAAENQSQDAKSGDVNAKPLVQVLDIKLIGSTQERYRLLLSDAVSTQQAMLATQLNDRVKSGRVRKGSVVQLIEYICSPVQNRK
ncbi:hypothetical protein FH972_003026 [Carpinus fangiana]|uniref:Replication factor-A protein 1 N-terminal domain-containing protein n=1 Tax=Carpinus fangiana TaxID=176857 RepID=A0A5N6QGP4_9ROSI|nr:hypothetical protein FH972_003026 [Carpinus fangiana]